MPETDLTYRKILAFWTPLAVMWIFMGAEQPAVNAAVSRLADAKVHLAAFGVTFSLGIMVQSPMIQFLTAATALSGSRRNYRLLLRFCVIIGSVLTILHLVVAVTPLYGFVTRNLFGVPEEIVGPSRIGFIIALPWALGIGFRRLWQGVLIRYGETRIVMAGVITRIAVLIIVLWAGVLVKTIPGVIVGTVGYTAGIIAAAAVTYVSARGVIRAMPENDDSGHGKLTVSGLSSFYLPLALTSFIGLTARPLLTFGLARAPNPLESLAAWPVVSAFMFLFTSMTISYQETVIALLSVPSRYRILKRFAYIIGIGMTAVFCVVAFSPLGRFWYRTVTGIPADLMGFVNAPTVIVALSPFLAALTSWYRGLAVQGRRTFEITRAGITYVVVLAAVMVLAAAFLPISGVASAAVAVMAAMAAETVYLRVRTMDFAGRADMMGDQADLSA